MEEANERGVGRGRQRKKWREERGLTHGKGMNEKKTDEGSGEIRKDCFEDKKGRKDKGLS